MDVILKVNGEDIERFVITNTTKEMAGVNTYSWSRISCKPPMHREWTSGTVEHDMADGALELVAKVCRSADVPA